MNYLDRKSMGVEVFLASRSPLFTRNNELTADELTARLRFQPAYARAKVVKDIKEVLAVLKSSRFDLSSVIPEEILSLSDREINVEHIGGIKPFFEWLGILWRDNDYARSNWLNSLKSASASIGGATGECLLALGTGHNQRALVRRLDNGDMEMSLHERTWGRLSLTFPCAELTAPHDLPVLGFVNFIEAREENGSYIFNLIIDTEFSPTISDTRVIEDDGWAELTFKSSTPVARLEPIDYFNAIKMRGVAKLEAVRSAGAVLCEKSEIAGEGLLTVTERAQLPLARFLSETKKLTDAGKEGDARSETQLLLLLDNRYAVQRVASVLDDGTSKRISSLFKKIADALEEEDLDTALKRAVNVSAALDDIAKEGTGQPLVDKLYDIFEKASPSDEAQNVREDSYRAACAAFAEAVEPNIFKLGFKGQFPEYIRTRGKRVYLLTACPSSDPETGLDGQIIYRFTFRQAKTRRSRKEKKALTLRGVPQERVSAADLSLEYPYVSKHGMLDFITREGGVTVTVDSVGNRCSVNCDEAALLTKTVKRSLKNRSLNRAMRKNRKARRKGQKSTHPFINAFLRFAPASNIMCAVSGIAYGVLYYLGYAENIPFRAAAVAVALSGLVTAFILALLYCLFKRRKVWEY